MPDVTRIIEQTATESIYNDDWLIKDSVNQGTTKIQPSVLKAWINDGMATDEELETAVDDTITKLSAVGSSSGAIATFDDGSDLPMPKLEVAIEPQQQGSGDPSPENVRSISGWDEVDVSVSGVNVWDEEWELGSLNLETGAKTNANNLIRSKNFIPIKPNTNYFFKYFVTELSNSNFYICFYDSNKQFLSSVSEHDTVTTPLNAYFMLFRCHSSYGTTYNNDVSINYPSTDTSYHAYNGHTYTIDLDGTRYGGTLDVVSGVLVVDSIGVDMATLNWTNSSGNHRSYCYAIKNEIKIPSTQSAKSGCIAEKYFEIPSTGSLIDGEFAVTQSGDLIFYYDGVNPPTGLLVYPLATPQTYQLTPTQVKSLLGVNNIWADTGDVLDAEYIRDMTTIINYLIARIEALENS